MRYVHNPAPWWRIIKCFRFNVVTMTQHSTACGDRTQGLSIRSPTLYHYATALPKAQKSTATSRRQWGGDLMFLVQGHNTVPRVGSIKNYVETNDTIRYMLKILAWLTLNSSFLLVLQKKKKSLGLRSFCMSTWFSIQFSPSRFLERAIPSDCSSSWQLLTFTIFFGLSESTSSRKSDLKSKFCDSVD